RNRIVAADGRAIGNGMKRRDEHGQSEMHREMLYRDGAVADAALSIGDIGASAFEEINVGGIAKAHSVLGLRRRVEEIIGQSRGVADIGETIAENEQLLRRRRGRLWIGDRREQQ